MHDKLMIWTVYKNPLDAPGQYAARRFETDKPTSDSFSDPDIEKVREWIQIESSKYRQGELTRLPRSENDDPVIYEVWL